MFKVATLLRNTVITGLTCRTCAIMFKIYFIFLWLCLCVYEDTVCAAGGYFDKAVLIVGPRLFTVSLIVTLLALVFLVKCVRFWICVHALPIWAYFCWLGHIRGHIESSHIGLLAFVVSEKWRLKAQKSLYGLGCNKPSLWHASSSQTSSSYICWLQRRDYLGLHGSLSLSTCPLSLQEILKVKSGDPKFSDSFS